MSNMDQKQDSCVFKLVTGGNSTEPHFLFLPSNSTIQDAAKNPATFLSVPVSDIVGNTSQTYAGLEPEWQANLTHVITANQRTGSGLATIAIFPDGTNRAFGSCATSLAVSGDNIPREKIPVVDLVKELGEFATGWAQIIPSGCQSAADFDKARSKVPAVAKPK